MGGDRRPSVVLIQPWPNSGFIDDDAALLAGFANVSRVLFDGSASSLLRRVRRLRRQGSADVLLAWFAIPAYIPWLALWCRLRRCPLIVFTGGVDVARVPEIAYGLPLRLGSRLRIALGLTLANAVVPFSASAADEARAISRPRRVEIVYPAIDTDFYTMGDGTAERNLALTVGTIGASFIRQKGLDVFVEAARLLPDVHFVIAGRVVDDAGRAFLAGAPPNVSATERFLSRAELRELYQTSACYIQASRYEGFGVACAEAMACGSIPIVHAVRSLPEVVADTGWQVPSLDPALYAKAVERAMEVGPSVRREARKRVQDKFAMAVRSENLARLLGEIAPGMVWVLPHTLE